MGVFSLGNKFETRQSPFQSWPDSRVFPAPSHFVWRVGASEGTKGLESLGFQKKHGWISWIEANPDHFEGPVLISSGRNQSFGRCGASPGWALDVGFAGLPCASHVVEGVAQVVILLGFVYRRFLSTQCSLA